MSATIEPSPATLWRQYELTDGSAFRWRLDRLHLYLTRTDNEWLMQRWWDPPPSVAESELVFGERVQWEPHNSSADVTRIQLSTEFEHLSLSPMTADLEVVSKPTAPLVIAPNARARLYVGSPLWLRLSASRTDPRLPDAQLLEPFAIDPPKPTWFGRNPAVGALCYASRTRGLATMDAVRAARVPWRAVTPLELVNGGNDGWRLDKIKLPTPALELFRDDEGNIWTPTLEVRRDHHGVTRPATIHSGAPVESRGAVRVTVAREHDPSWLARAQASLFESN